MSNQSTKLKLQKKLFRLKAEDADLHAKLYAKGYNKLIDMLENVGITTTQPQFDEDIDEDKLEDLQQDLDALHDEINEARKILAIMVRKFNDPVSRIVDGI